MGEQSTELQIRNQRVIEKLEDQKFGSDAFTKHIIDEGVRRIGIGANPDMVYNWFNELKQVYGRNMIPSARELKKKQEAKERRALKAAKKAELTTEMKSMEKELGLLVVGYFEWKEVDESYMNMVEKYVTSKGMIFTWEENDINGFFITNKELSKDDIKKFKKMTNKLENETQQYYYSFVSDVVKVASDKGDLQSFLNTLN